MKVLVPEDDIRGKVHKSDCIERIIKSYGYTLLDPASKRDRYCEYDVLELPRSYRPTGSVYRSSGRMVPEGSIQFLEQNVWHTECVCGIGDVYGDLCTPMAWRIHA